MRNTLLLAGLLCLPVVAQEINIVQLSDQDRQEALAILSEEHQLEVRKHDFQLRMIHNYLESTDGKSGCVVDGMVVDPKWGCAEFQVTSDGKFITPSAGITKYSGLFEMKNGTAVQVTPTESGYVPE